MNERERRTDIPVSVSLDQALAQEETDVPMLPQDKRRILKMSVLAVLSAVVISGLAKMLVLIIDLFTALAFHGRFTFQHLSPADNRYGWWVVLVPAAGGLVVGLIAYYGSKAIRGHGIPEAMEQVLTNRSRIKPSLTFLKPFSAAVSIGTGGPFGAEGPIIATGGAFGSTVGQFSRVTANERKVLLAAGATAGMSAIFGSPVAALFLAVELLLFEFSPRSLIPVALACITGAAGHRLLFEHEPVFAMPPMAYPSDPALFTYSLMGLVIGFAALLITKFVYVLEDGFERSPIHWMWWPALGGLAVGIIGYFAPRTLGVGYDNITLLLTGNAPLAILLSLAFLKLLSWAIALGSGTSGGTLAPLLTMGAAMGTLAGMAALAWMPSLPVTLPMAALVGMAAMFAGASRALLTSIAFALETTGRAEALLPLLGACAASYLVSYLFSKNTIMTEKIARRGVRAPDSYLPEVLARITVGRVMNDRPPVVARHATIADALRTVPTGAEHALVVDDEDGFCGLVSVADLRGHAASDPVDGRIIIPPAVQDGDDLRHAVGIMARTRSKALAVTAEGNKVVGTLDYANVLRAYVEDLAEHEEEEDARFVLKRQRLKVLVRSKWLMEHMFRN
ncbi:MAG: chloride channel protein [Flavobacteriales bacterium]